jgi:phosphatidylinositol alpha-mannosyltransferase
MVRVTPVKVGIVVPYSWSFWGGVQEHADHQARALRRLGVDARILMGHDPPGRLTHLLHPKQGRHERPPDYVIPVGRSVIVPANASLPNLILGPQSMLRMRRAFERERFDVVHVHEPFAPVLSIFALIAAPCPIVATCHSAGERLGWYPLGKMMWGIGAERIDYRIAVSEWARQSAEPYVGGPFEVIPNGVDLPPRADPGGRSGNVVFIGRNEPRKGLPILLGSWPEVHARTGGRLRIVGADPLSVRWLARRQGFSLEGVDLLGGLYEEDLTQELLTASLLVAPSLGGESFGMVLTRAFSCALPVVASNIEGYAAVAGPEHGILVPPGDDEVLGRALLELLEDEPRRRALGAAARQAARYYSWDRIGRRLIEIYEGLVEPAVAKAKAAAAA